MVKPPDWPNRRFWQVHLSTAIISSITFGIVMIVVTTPRYEHRIRTWGMSNNYSYNPLEVRGWPLQYEIDGAGPFDDLRETIWAPGVNFATNLQYALLIDILTAIGFSIGIGLASEYYLRHREDRKP